MMKLYKDFYRMYGVRKDAQFLAPVMPLIADLKLPRDSIYHHVGQASVLDSGPASDDIMFNQYNKPIYVGHIVRNGDDLGHPRPVSLVADNEVRPYHTRNRRFKRMQDLEAVQRDDQTLIIYNYAFIPRFYAYNRSVYTDYNRWHNQQAAVWQNIADLMIANNRQHFIRAQLPKILPSVADLNTATNNMNQKMVTLFDTPESLFLLELWKWFGEDRETSLVSKVDKQHYSRVNIVFLESGRWVCFNLGLLDSWRKATKEELKKNPEANEKGLDASTLQRRFLRLVMSLFEARTVASSEITQVADRAPADDKSAAGAPVVDKAVKVPVLDRKTGKVQLVSPAESGEVLVHTIDAPDDSADSITDSTEISTKIDADLAELENISIRVRGVLNEQGQKVKEVVIEEAATLDEAYIKVARRYSESGDLSAAEYLRFEKAASAYKSIKAPDGTTLDKFIVIPKEAVALPESPNVVSDIPTVTDKTMLKSSLQTFDSKYVKEVFPRDVASMVLNVQNAGIAVTDYQVEEVKTVLGSYLDTTVKVLPIEGAPSTWRFKLPLLNEDGSYMANNVKYRLRKQRADLPIRKVAADRVALTSYYGKTFVTRSTKRVNDYGRWLSNAVMAKGLDDGDLTVKDMYPGNVFDHLFVSPRLYSILAMSFRGFSVSGFELSFDHSRRKSNYGEDTLKQYETDGAVVFGKNNKGQFLVMHKDDSLYVADQGKLIEFPPMEELLHLDGTRAPVDFSEVKVFGNAIPVGFVLAYEMGLQRLIDMLGVTPRRVQAGSRTNMLPHEYSLVFADETWIFSRNDAKAAMILAGFNEYRQAIRQYNAYDFDKRDVYWNVLDANKLSTRYIREMDLLYQMFIDPITKELLIDMREPTDFRGLLLRASEMLLTDSHPDELDSAYMRLRGNERMAGAVYSELVKAIRLHNGRSGKSRFPIDLYPHAVWQNIAKDPSNSLISEINPIQNLKEIEAVTYSGVGGRNSRSMTKHTRAYHDNDMGTISESTVDSGSVAINTFTPADPQFNSLRGTSRRYEIGKTGATALLSTSALLSVGSDKDDPKRVNFIAIQHSHGVACKGYSQAAVRTGYEQVLAHRVGDLFAVTAKQSGKVISKSDTGVVVEYADGKTQGYEIGRRFGAAAGLTIAHNVVSYLEEGQKFKEGDILSFNEGYFEKDVLNPRNVVWKSGILVKTVVMETTQTLEDSSSISQRLADQLRTPITKVRTIVVRFDQKVDRLVKVGAEVASEDILCVIEDPVDGENFLFDQESLDTLRVLGSQTPTAKARGVVERVEVFYHGEKEDMSDSLRTLATASDRELMKRNKSVGQEAFTGSVDESFRVDGDPLMLDRLVIRFYITTEAAAGAGDKGVFGNQMKTVFGEILPGEIKTEDGQVIDAVFGYKSIADRIVLSPEIIGTTTVLLDVIAQEAVRRYYS